jgi:MoaA/NifB/PqqE/SkfB family radical SAM enzyme
VRRFDQDWTGNQLTVAARNAWRRVEWFTKGRSVGQLANGAMAVAAFGLGRQHLRSWPVLVKVDLSPMCNLHCTYCVHASPSLDATGVLAEQSFASSQRLAVSDFGRLVEQMRGRVAVVALYYVGDPLVHPELPQICAIANSAGLNTHVSTNFSFQLGDDRLEALVRSGLSHLTVCVDSMRQDRYERTRVGGHIDLVLKNLVRVLEIRRQLGRAAPNVEVQFIKYRHNEDELESAAEWCARQGVDQFTTYWGNLHNYADLSPTGYRTGAALEGELFPRCAWPWFALQVKYNGDAIPCCYHRVSEQYRVGGDARSVGNIFDQGLYEVWNSPVYQGLRRLVSNPAAAEAELAEESFCYGCPVLFDTGGAGLPVTAETTTWEQVYFRSSSGAVRRRANDLSLQSPPSPHFGGQS